MAGVLLEARPYRPFKSSEEYLYAMKEDLAEWLNILYSELEINVDNFMDKLETGVVLCKHANSVKKSAEEYVARKQLRKMTSSQAMTASLMTKTALPISRMGEIIYRLSAKPGTFFARDNVSNFIDFCRRGLEIIECLLFETDDLIMRKNEKNVILCLLEVARRGAKFGMLAPILVQMEREIDREIAAEQRLERGETEEESSSSEDEEESRPLPQIITNDLKNLDEMVRDLVEKCTCPTQFPMIRVSEGKYRIGDTKVLIFVRILRSHVMVRVGGGWDTLSHYLDKHDPCRCRSGHKVALSSKVILKNSGAIELNNAQVLYERSPPRTRRSSASSSSSGHGGSNALNASSNRSRSPTPRGENPKSGSRSQKYVSTVLLDAARQDSLSPYRGRSVSPGMGAKGLGLGLTAPTAASRNRSRSPSTQQKKNSESLVQTKSNEVKYATATLFNEAEMEQAAVMPDAKENLNCSNCEDGKQNDSGSEVSDEGYRSLGLIVTTPVIGEGKVVSSDAKPVKNGHCGNYSVEDSDPRGSPTSERSFASIDDVDNQLNGSKKKSVREGSKSLSKMQLPGKKTLRSSHSRGSSPLGSRGNSFPARGSPATIESGPGRRKSTRENETRKSSTRSRSATPDRYNAVEVPVLQQQTKSGSTASENKFGTWNGKTKKRAGLPAEVHGNPSSHNFVRNGMGRRSLGANSNSKLYDPSTGRRFGKAGSESKTVSPLIADLLKAKNLDDDKTILLKMKEIIDQYSEIFEDNSKEEEKKLESGPDENLDFTREWVKNNGSLRKMENGNVTEEKSSPASSSPSRRKDVKFEGSQSKIPAPIFFKQNQISS